MTRLFLVFALVPSLWGSSLVSPSVGSPLPRAQEQDSSSLESEESAKKSESEEAKETFSGLSYRQIGPYVSGRVSRVCGVPGDPLTYYAATAAGGVWKSTQGGMQWSPIFDDQPISSIGSIVVAPSDPQVVWVGSGEANIRGNVAEGNGIYVSTDAGATWNHVWKAEGQIGSILVHPQDPETLYAAVLGSPFGPSEERGVYRTRDLGKTWKRVLFVDVDTGASDICMHPSNPRILIAGMWKTRRSPWGHTSGGESQGLWISKDQGETWAALKDDAGLPEGAWGRVGVRFAPSDPDRVYALIEANDGGLFRSDDAGGSWTLIQDSRGLTQRAWYYMTLTVDPTDADTVWFPQVAMLRTDDGGKTIRPVQGGGWDYHDVWIAPEDPNRMIVASDGGVSLSRDGGESWHRPFLPLGQFYHVSIDSSQPYRVLGSVQDLGTVSGPSHSLRSGGILASDWHGVGGGEAGHVVADPEDPNIVWAGEYLGIITRYDRRLNHSSVVSVYPYDGSGHGAKDLKYRFQWTAPILISPHDSDTVYHASNVLFRTRDKGQTWDAISPDLSYNDLSKQEWSGGPITGDNTGVEYYGTIFALSESKHQAGEIWAGTDDGRLHLTRDGGENWTEITPSDLPQWATIRVIELSDHTPGLAYVVADNHRLDDETPYLWQTRDFGETWSSLTKALDPEIYLHVIREDKSDPNILYLGTERGVQISRDGGESFEALRLNMPTVAVVDMQVSDHDLIVGTLGRSIWILDDLTPIRAWGKGMGDSVSHLFAPLPSIRWHIGGSSEGSTEGAGSNPPGGMSLTYFLKEPLEETFSIRIKDRDGRVIRELSSEAKETLLDAGHPSASPDFKVSPELSNEKGLNRAVWDLTENAPTFVKGAMLDWGDPGSGPLVLPGAYTVEMVVGENVQSYEGKVLSDPRITVPLEDQVKQRDFARRVAALFSTISQEVKKIRDLRDQLSDLRQRWEANEAFKDLDAKATKIVEQLDIIEGKLHNPKAEVTYDILAGRHGGAMLHSQVEWLFLISRDHFGPPTQGMLKSMEIYQAEFQGHQKDFSTLVEGDVQELEQICRERRLPYITVGDE